ncbi:hypothetical protein PsorP6_014524 [Peronosclerospora sorghi]|uniref:Uncharacterized protein n=1 Tax=Peronosclerospora sorghi TaxID=230839 RepID=A0ACC0VVA6_9STRA|nr:hypothetical protein PsorP6_014524 [Peronosclerospora sorghi]
MSNLLLSPGSEKLAFHSPSSTRLWKAYQNRTRSGPICTLAHVLQQYIVALENSVQNRSTGGRETKSHLYHVPVSTSPLISVEER